MKDSVSDVSYLKVAGDKLRLRRSYQYYDQCMCQVGLTGVKWCDFYVWCENDSQCEIIAFDTSVFARMLAKLDAFFVSYFLPAKQVG